MKVKTLFLVVLFFNCFAYANKIAVLSDHFKKYRDSKLVKIKMEKSVKSNLLGKIKNQEAVLYIGNGKIRLEILHPEKNVLIYDKEVIWNIQYPSADFPGEIMVTKTKVSKKNKGQVFLSQLFTEKDLGSLFNLSTTTSICEKSENYCLEAKAREVQLKNLMIHIPEKTKRVKLISYMDELDNETTYTVVKTEFLSSKKEELFKYVPEKGAKVTEL